MTEFRPSDIAFTLTTDAKRLLRQLADGPVEVFRLVGGPFELLRHRLAQSVQSGRGYEITATGTGQMMGEYLKGQMADV